MQNSFGIAAAVPATAHRAKTLLWLTVTRSGLMSFMLHMFIGCIFLASLAGSNFCSFAVVFYMLINDINGLIVFMVLSTEWF